MGTQKNGRTKPAKVVLAPTFLTSELLSALETYAAETSRASLAEVNPMFAHSTADKAYEALLQAIDNIQNACAKEPAMHLVDMAVASQVSMSEGLLTEGDGALPLRHGSANRSINHWLLESAGINPDACSRAEAFKRAERQLSPLH